MLLTCGLLAPPAFCAFLLFCPILFQSHRHCIQVAGSALRLYADDHEGRYPYDTNGYGAALLTLLKGDILGGTNSFHVGPITAPGDRGSVFTNALIHNVVVPESSCTRVYVQGLSESNNPELAILFDKYPTRGGDHFRRPWGPLQREVIFVMSGFKVIDEADWPKFAQRQIQLLIAEGFSRERAMELYRPTKNP